jgi:hypothetical protein
VFLGGIYPIKLKNEQKIAQKIAFSKKQFKGPVEAFFEKKSKKACFWPFLPSFLEGQKSFIGSFSRKQHFKKCKKTRFLHFFFEKRPYKNIIKFRKNTKNSVF